MEIVTSIVVLAGLAVCFAGIYALLFDPKFIDEEQRIEMVRRERRARSAVHNSR
ncbi:hypothetical protein IT396_01905 [Candidatus Nomurabacteria bacterium]|nr:hypothetical protein [Candidatus Nomurabacteria bacterium]